MKKRMRKPLAAVAAVALSAATLAIATPAQAAATISSVTLAPFVAIVNGDSYCGDRVKATIKVFDPNNETDSYSASVESFAPNGDSTDFLWPMARTVSGDYATFTGWITNCGQWDPPGKYRAHIQVDWVAADYSDIGTEQTDRTFYIKRPTSLTYNASPEPAKKGSYLTHSGRLKFDPFGPGAMYGPSGVNLRLDFKPAGSTTYQYKTTITSGSSGYYSKKVATTGDGTWRLSFPTNNWRQTQYKYDYVDTY
jgi:hypothetical protein